MVLGASTDLDLGGRMEVQLRSPVYLDRFRVYFGARPQGFTEVRGRELHQRDVSGVGTRDGSVHESALCRSLGDGHEWRRRRRRGRPCLFGGVPSLPVAAS